MMAREPSGARAAGDPDGRPGGARLSALGLLKRRPGPRDHRALRLRQDPRARAPSRTRAGCAWTTCPPPSSPASSTSWAARGSARARPWWWTCASRGFLERFPEVYRRLRRRVAASLLFLEADERVLLRRFRETRRPHPLAVNQPVVEGIREEREALRPIRKMADHILDTSAYTVHELREYVRDRYGARDDAGRMVVSVMSFGYKYGVPSEADLVFDVRFLPNPNFVPRAQEAHRRVVRPAAGRDPRPLRRERRGQEHAHEGALGRAPERQLRRRDPPPGRPRPLRHPPRRRSARHRPHRPGAGPRARAVRGREPAARPPARPRRGSCAGTPCARRPGAPSPSWASRSTRRRPVKELGIGQQQMVEIAKALAKDARGPGARRAHGGAHRGRRPPPARLPARAARPRASR